MALEQDKVQYLDDWQDLKDYTKKKHEAAEKEKDQHNVTKDFVNSEIATAEQKDNQEEQAEYAKIYQKIADISAGGGVDLSPYLKIEDASANFATKAEIPDLADYTTQQQLQEAVSDKATISQVAALEQKVDAIDLTPYAKIDDVSAEYAKKSEITDMATEQYVQEQIAELVDGAPEELNSFKELSDALKDQSDAVSAINAVLATKADASTVYTKEQADAKFLIDDDLAEYAKKTDIPDTSAFATRTEVEEVAAQIPSIEGLISEQQLTEALEPYALKTDIPDVSAIQNEVDTLSQSVELKANSADVYTKAQADEKFLIEDDIANLASKQELQSGLEAVTAQIPDTSAFITDAALEPYALKSEIPNVSDFTSRDEVSAADSSILKNILSRIWTTKDADPSKGCFTTKLINSDGNLAEIFNESDGGGVIFSDNTRKIKSFVGVNDGGDPSTGIHAQIYSKNVSTNEGARLNINPSGMFYGVGASTPIDDAHELAVKGDIPSVEGLVSEQQMTTALQDKATIEQVSTVDEKVDALDASVAEGYVPVGEYNALVDKVKVLQAYIDSFVTVDPKKREEANDEIVNSLSDDNTSVVVPTEIKSIVYPETTKGLTIIAPLADDSSVQITSEKYFYLDNTSETGNTSTAITGIEGATSATTCYLTGTFDTLTLTNISISKSSSKNAAVVSNIVIPEDNETSISLTVALTENATITNNSDKDVTISAGNTPEGVEPIVTIVAPNSKVTLNNGTFGEVSSNVSENTLIVGNSTHINKLTVVHGNVLVMNLNVSDNIDEVINPTQFTVLPYSMDVTDKTSFSKIFNNSGTYNVLNDIDNCSRIVPGTFSNSRIVVNLNGNTVSFNDPNFSIKTRGTVEATFKNGNIVSTAAYGFWADKKTIINLENVNITALTHCLYLYDKQAVINVRGGRLWCTDDPKYTVNYYDSQWDPNNKRVHLLENVECVDFNPAESYGELSSPNNLLDDGYHTESYTETIEGVEHTIYKVVKDNE